MPRTKTPKIVKRTYDSFDLRVVAKEKPNEAHMVYALKEGELLDMETSSRPFHHVATGPAIVIRTENMGINTCEYYVNDPHVWEWIAKLIANDYVTVEHPTVN